MAYNGEPITNTNAEAVASDSLLQGRIQARIFELAAIQANDFAKLQGKEGSGMPFWEKGDLTKGAGDKVTFSVQAMPAGPGVRGETALVGRESKLKLKTYTCQIDWFRDAVSISRKDLSFLSAGKDLRSSANEMIGKKMGLKQQMDMMHKLLRTSNVITLRPNDKPTRDSLTIVDTVSPSFFTSSKARLQRLGARPITTSKMTSGSIVNHFLAFLPQDPMTNLRDSGTFGNAQMQAAPRSLTENPLFNGTLPDWNAIKFWEHIVIAGDTNDAIGSPLHAEARSGGTGTIGSSTQIVPATTSFNILGGDGTSALCDYFRDFPGYDYKFTEDQSAAPDSATYYFWIVNASGADIGKMCFYSYTGSANTGNQITAITGILGATDSGIRNDLVGEVTYANVSAHPVLGNVFSGTHPKGSYIIPANAKGVPIARGFLFGAGAALRAYGEVKNELIEQDFDYKFQMSRGYQGIWGQSASLDTDSVPRNYVILEAAVEIPGIPVASMPAA